MRYTPAAIIRTEIRFGRDLLIGDYSAKLVKTLLISGNPNLKEVFTTNKYAPKPIHITPLFIEENRKKIAIYPKYIPPLNTAKIDPSKRSTKIKVKLSSSEKYVFYIGTVVDMLDDLLKGLSNADRFMFGDEVVKVEDISVYINYVDVTNEANKIWNDLVNASARYVKIVFESPAILRKSLLLFRYKKKTFNPTPDAVFSIPIYMSLADMGRLKLYKPCVLGIATIFDDTYAIRRTTDLVWYLYSGRWLPALIGYAKYVVDYEALKHVHAFMQTKYGIDFTEIVAKALALARVYGIGNGRAAGFGHISLQLRSK